MIGFGDDWFGTPAIQAQPASVVPIDLRAFAS
jgi:hypothetical protein